eukprot:7357447-Prymnesium_polylepis.1
MYHAPRHPKAVSALLALSDDILCRLSGSVRLCQRGSVRLCQALSDQGSTRGWASTGVVARCTRLESTLATLAAGAC